MKMKRRYGIAALVLLLALAAFGCQRQPAGDALTPEERTALYQTAIEQARSQEDNDAFAILTDPDGDFADVIFPMLGVSDSDMSAYAISISPVNIRAYGIAAIYPADGRADAVHSGLSNFVTQQKQSFERYLPDQYEIASSAKVETLEDGTILLVMCSGQDAVLDALRQAIEG